MRQVLERAAYFMMRGDRGSAADAYLEAAVTYASVERRNEALALAYTALELEPRRFVAIAVGSLVRALGRRAAALCGRAARIHIEHDRSHDAAALLELIIALDPTDADARIRLAELYARTGRREAGIELEVAALAAFADDGNNRGVLAIAQHLLTLDGRSREALRALVSTHQRLGEYTAALRAATTLLTIDARDEVALEVVARIMVERGQAERGLDILRQLVARLGPRDAALVLGRARRWCSAEEYQRAIEEFRRTAEEVIELTHDDLMPLTG